jgi:HEAT repeat protein
MSRLILIAVSLMGWLGAIEPAQVLFLLHRGNVERGVEAYRARVEEQGTHDYELLREMALVLLRRGEASGDPEDQLLSLLGAGVSGSREVLPILREGVSSAHPQVQLASVGQLGHLPFDEADELLLKALGSNYPIIRLEALFQLANKRHPAATDQLEALMAKLPREVWVLFPQLFCLTHQRGADAVLRRMMASEDGRLKQAAILAVASAGRDEFLPLVRSLSFHTDPLLQEACAVALGKLLDSSSMERMRELADSEEPAVRLAALRALHALGDEGVRTEVEQMARQGELFAIAALGEIPGSEETLGHLIYSRDLSVRINAAVSLVQLRDRRARLGLEELLILDPRDLALRLGHSPGGALTCLDAVPSATMRVKGDPVLEELSRSLRESILLEAMHLEEETFLDIASKIFGSGQSDLVPALVTCLENMATPGAVALLKKERERAGAPLIRDYCNLALFKLGEEGPYEADVKGWLERQKGHDLIQLRPLVAFADKADVKTTYRLTPQETSRLMVETFSAMAMRKDQEGVDALLQAIAHGNEHNRYALAGLLVQASE